MKFRETKRVVKPATIQKYASSSSLDQYLVEINKIPLLRIDQEQEAARQAQAGSQEGIDTLVKHNLRFVISVAKKYQYASVPLVDLIEEGNTGLIRAAHKFDPDRGVKFISYAVWWIRQAILDGLARHGGTTRIPINRAGEVHRLTREVHRIMQYEGTSYDVALERLRVQREAEGKPVHPVSYDLLAGLANTVSLDAPAYGDVHKNVFNMVPATNAGPVENFEEGELESIIGKALEPSKESAIPARKRAYMRMPRERISERDARVLKLYFGLEDGQEYTLERIGEMLGVTRERVRQIKERGLKRLREDPKLLESYETRFGPLTRRD